MDRQSGEEQIDKLVERGAELFAAGRYVEGVDVAKHACALTSQAFGSDDRRYASSLHDLAILEKKAGYFNDAEEHARLALGILDDTKDDDLIRTHVLNALIEIEIAQRNLDAALDFAAEALDARRTLLGERHLLVAESLNNFAGVYVAKGEIRQAIPLAQEALDMRRELSEQLGPEFVESAFNLAQLHSDIGDHASAAHLFDEALAICRTQLGPHHPHTGTVLLLIGREHQKVGDDDTAIHYFEEALQVFAETLPATHPSIANALEDLGSVNIDRGEYADAQRRLLDALQIREEAFGRHHPQVIATLLRLGKLRIEIKDFAGAGSAFLEVLEDPRVEESEAKAAVIGLAVTYSQIGEYGQAVDLLRHALASTDATDPWTVGAMNNLGLSLMYLGDSEEAASCFSRALESSRRADPVDHESEAGTLNNIGLLHSRLGDYMAAEPFLRGALAVRKALFGDTHPGVADNLNNLALNAAAMKHFDRALELFEQCSAIYDRVIGMVFASSSEAQRLAYLARIREKQSLVLSAVVEMGLDDIGPVSAGFDVALRRKALTIDAFAIQRQATSGAAASRLSEQKQQLRLLNGQIARRTLDGPGAEGLAEHRALLDEWAERKGRLESELADDIPEMDITRALRNIDTERVARALPAGSVLLEFVRYRPFNFAAAAGRGEDLWAPARYLAFVLKAQEPASLVARDLGEADPIDRMVTELRTAIGRRGSSHRGHDLRSAIFDPVVGPFGEVRRVFVAPDGNLATLPFEVLPLADGRFLIDEFEFSYLGVGREILRFRSSAGRSQEPPLVVAAPDFDLRLDATAAQPPEDDTASRQSRDLRGARPHFSPLAGTREEGNRVGAILGVAPLLGRDATKGRIRAARSPRVLHIATHGFFLPDQPGLEIDAMTTPTAGHDDPTRYLGAGAENPMLRSGVGLAGANTRLNGGVLPSDAEDGILNADDVCQLELSNTDLVVLSACDTGLGDVAEGEGVLGLTRGFLIAGARSIVMSLWKVPDGATAELMEAFYAQLASGIPRSRALHAAQNLVRRSRPDPVFWGAFVCHGEPGPVA